MVSAWFALTRQGSSPAAVSALQLIVLRNWYKALIAVLLGNLVYFLVLMPHLPAAGRHRPNHLDWGLLIDFWVCLAVYGFIDLLARKSKPSDGTLR